MSGSSHRQRNNPPCLHDVFIKGLCGNCGARLETPQSSSVSMILSVPELKVTQRLAREIGKDDQLRLINDRKLVLLVDLDQTLLHTTHEEVKNDPNVTSFTLWPGHPTYYTKLRPHLEEFLEEMSTMYQMHIFTFGCHEYAHKIASLIDPDQKYFGNRILSRDESVDRFSKSGNLNNLFPCGDAMVCIIDDRSDVWQNAGNLIQVKPYCYFRTSISDGAGRQKIEEENESIDRDVDQLEALLGFGKNDQEEREQEVKGDREDAQSEPQKESDKRIDSEQDVIEKKGDYNQVQETLETPSVKRKNDQDPDHESKRIKTLPKAQVEVDKGESSSEMESSESPIEDTDTHLIHLIKILRRIYEKWYMELDRETEFLTPEEEGRIAYKLPDIKDIITKYLRKKF